MPAKEQMPGYIYQEATALLKRAQSFDRENEIGVTEATWRPQLKYPGHPFGIFLATDIHYGSINTDYDAIDHHLGIVETTPNMTMVTNGDHVDNFNVTGKWATGVYENPLPPQLQTRAFLDRFKQLSLKGKVGVMSFGNHDDFGDVTGYDWFNTYARDLGIPIFTSGGFLHILHGKEHYGLALTHKYWGTSKLNPTNATKRFWEHEYPQADIVFLGHTHQSEMLLWERGGKELIAVIGGTFKSEDDFARKRGIGGRSGRPGYTVVLYPQDHKMLGFKHIEDAQDYLNWTIENDRKRPDIPGSAIVLENEA